MMRILSLGAGVQSTTMALMAAHGEIGPMPDAAIFADTGAEPKPVYDHLRWLMSDNVLPFPVHIVSNGNIADDLRRGFSSVGGQGRFAGAPFFIKAVKESNGSYELAMGRRQCTRHYKVDVIAQAMRTLLGAKPRARIKPGSIEVWIGISLDEAIRARPSRHAWQVNRHPLLEMKINRLQCLEWLDKRGYIRPPKSACTFCPYRSDDQWRWMKENDPDSWQQAIDIDKVIRNGGHMTRWRNELYVHRSLKPLDEVDLSTAEDRGQIDLFNNECEGMCGV